MHCGFGNLWNFEVFQRELRGKGQAHCSLCKLCKLCNLCRLHHQHHNLWPVYGDLQSRLLACSLRWTYCQKCQTTRFVCKALHIACIILYKFSIKQYEASQCKHVACLHNSVGSFIQRQCVRWVKVIPTCFCTIRPAHVTRHFEAQSPTWRSGKNARRGRNARRLKMRMIRQVGPVVPLGSGQLSHLSQLSQLKCQSFESLKTSQELLKLCWSFPEFFQQLVSNWLSLGGTFSSLGRELQDYGLDLNLFDKSRHIWIIWHVKWDKHIVTSCQHTHTHQHDMLLSASISIQGYIGGSCTCSCPIDQDFGRCYPLPDMVFERWHYGQEAKGPDGMGREGMMAWWHDGRLWHILWHLQLHPHVKIIAWLCWKC